MVFSSFKKYATFSGRARRKEYWMFFLFNVIFTILALFVDTVLGTKLEYSDYGIISAIYAVAMIIPGISLTLRRLHDIDKGWPWLFISFIPFIGQIWIIILLCREGNNQANEYGLSPKALTNND